MSIDGKAMNAAAADDAYRARRGDEGAAKPDLFGGIRIDHPHRITVL